MYTFNIGLNRNDGREPNSVARTFAALDDAGFDHIEQVRVATILYQDGSEERTVVFTVSELPTGLRHRIIHLCDFYLAQDCIAYRDNTTGQGHLVGPRASKWGHFDYNFFLEVKRND